MTTLSGVPHPLPASAASRPVRSPGSAIAWVESPLQLLSAVEAAALGRTGQRTQVVLRSGSPTLRATGSAVAALGLPDGVEVRAEADAPAPWDRRDGSTWVLGDAFGGLAQRALVVHRPERVVLVDDGLGAVHLLGLLADPGAPPLVRARAGRSLPRAVLGRLAGWRLRDLAHSGRLEAVTALPVPTAVASGAAAAGLTVTPSDFAWLRSRPRGEAPEEPTVVLGTSLVAHGLLHAEPWLALVRRLVRDRGPVAYSPHRRESPAVLAALADEPGVRVRPAELPVELALRGLRAGQQVVGLPSTPLATLRTLLTGPTPTGAHVVPVRVAEDWWTPRATPAVRGAVLAALAPDAVTGREPRRG